MKKRGIKITSMFVAVTLFATSGFSIVKGGIPSAKAEIEYTSDLDLGFYNDYIDYQRSSIAFNDTSPEFYYQYFISLTAAALKDNYLQYGISSTERTNAYLDGLIEVLLFDYPPITDSEFVSKYGYVSVANFFSDNDKYEMFRRGVVNEGYGKYLKEKWREDSYGLKYSPSDMNSYFLKASSRIQVPASYSIDDNNIFREDIFNKELSGNYSSWKPFDYIWVDLYENPYADEFRCAIVHNFMNDLFLDYHQSHIYSNTQGNGNYYYDQIVDFYNYFVLGNGEINAYYAGHSFEKDGYLIADFDNNYKFRYSDLSPLAKDHILEMFKLAPKYFWYDDQKVNDYCALLGISRSELDIPSVNEKVYQSDVNGTVFDDLYNQVMSPQRTSSVPEDPVKRLEYLNKHLSDKVIHYDNIDYSIYSFTPQEMFDFMFNSRRDIEVEYTSDILNWPLRYIVSSGDWDENHNYDYANDYNQAVFNLFMINSYHFMIQYYDNYFEGNQPFETRHLFDIYNNTVNDLRYIITHNKLERYDVPMIEKIMNVYRLIGNCYIDGCSADKEEINILIDEYIMKLKGNDPTLVDGDSRLEDLKYALYNSTSPIHYDNIDTSKYIYTEESMFNLIVNSENKSYNFEFTPIYSELAKLNCINILDPNLGDDDIDYTSAKFFYSWPLSELFALNLDVYYHDYSENYFEGLYVYDINIAIHRFNSMVEEVKLIKDQKGFMDLDIEDIRNIYNLFRYINNFYIEGCSYTPEDVNRIIDEEIAYVESVKLVSSHEEPQVAEDAVPAVEVIPVEEPVEVIPLDEQTEDIPVEVVPLDEQKPEERVKEIYPSRSGHITEYEDGRKVYTYEGNGSGYVFGSEMSSPEQYHDTFKISTFDDINTWDYRYRVNYKDEAGYSEDAKACAIIHNWFADDFELLEYDKYNDEEGLIYEYNYAVSSFIDFVTGSTSILDYYFDDLSTEGKEHVLYLFGKVKKYYKNGASYSVSDINSIIEDVKSTYTHTR